MRNGGNVLTVLGSVLEAVGAAKMHNLKKNGTYPNEPTFTNGSLQIIAGSMCLRAGVP